MLVGIIQPRIEEALELVRDRLHASGLGRAAGRRAVLTGGGALLTGVREHAARVLDKQVRIGRPLGVHGLADATEGPAFAVASGLLAYVQQVPEQGNSEHIAIGAGRFQRLGRWLKENF